MKERHLAENTPTTPEQGQPGAAAPQSEVVLDDKNAHIAYANFARVTATPEEVIIDFALNPNPFMTGRQEIPVAQRLILNFFTAKRLLLALNNLVVQHENAFGSLELDYNRRRTMARPGGTK